MNIQVILQILCWISLGFLHLLVPNGLVCRAGECFVKPTDPANSTCPGEPCYTLNEYASDIATHHFGSNVTVLFRSGTHALNQSIDVSGVDNLALVGLNSPWITQIVCEIDSGLIGLSFTNISVLTIKNIGFINCHGSVAQGVHIRMEALHFKTVVNLTVTDILVRNCSEVGLGLENIMGYSEISSVTFSNNHKGHICIGYSDANNSHITIRNSMFEFGGTPIDIFINNPLYKIVLDIINITTHECMSWYADVTLTIYYFVPFFVDVNIKESRISSSRGAAIYLNLPYGTDAIHPSTIVSICIIDCTIIGNQKGGVSIKVREPLSNAIQSYMLFIKIVNSQITNNEIWMFDDSQGSALAVIYPGYRYSANVISRIVIDTVTFAHNYVKMAVVEPCHSTAEYMATVFLAYAQNIYFSNCQFVGSTGTAVYAFQSVIHVHHTVSFINNTACKGAAMAFYGNSSLIVHKGSHLHFINNHAENVGGAIFVDEKLPTAAFVYHMLLHTPHCFLWFADAKTSKDILLNARFTFSNNEAKNGGNAIYGGLSDTCLIAPILSKDDIESRHWTIFIYLRLISKFEPPISKDLSVISSDPVHVCFCENGKPNHTALLINQARYPGETFTISAVVVGQMFGAVSGSVYARFIPHDSDKEVPQLEELQQVQQTGSTQCSELSYTVLSSNRVVVLALTPTSATVLTYPDIDRLNKVISNYEYDEKSQTILSLPIYINITLRLCPPGFILSDHPARCVCDFQLEKNNFTCKIRDQTVLRRGTVWINASIIEKGVIIYYHCPFGYCSQAEIGVNLEAPDSQCTMNRSGILCGRCRSGLSLVLGTSQCRSCSNEYLAILIIFAAAGFALVVFLKVLNFTVTEGTINGLVFYANIIGANQAILFPSGRTNILTVFIAWVNLDFGIQICFFNGLNGYWKTWFQLIFPLYIWIVAALMITLSHYYTLVARLFGRNSVAILATLVLLSYAKLLRTIITVFSFAVLKLPNDSKCVVWLLDGNIKFFGTTHTPLFLVSLSFLLLLWLPYTAILVSVQCLQKYTNLKVVRWIVKLKPFFDAHFGHLKDKHRYWVGALLLVRGVLFLIFAANPTNAPSVNLLAIAIFSILLLAYTGNVGQVYKLWYLSLLENSFLINLAVLSAASLYVQPSISGQEAMTHISVSIAFVQFVGVVIFHAWKAVKVTTLWRTLKIKLHRPVHVDHSENGDGLQYHSLDNMQEMQPVNLRIRFNELGELTFEEH